MKTIKRITILVLISSILTTFSCTKEGKQGETGLAGTNGANGADGVDGNSNVLSESFTMIPSQWTTSGLVTFFSRPTPLLTNNIVNNGVVILYVESSTPNQWFALPFAISSYNMRYLFSENNLLVQIAGVSFPQTVSTDMNFRLVVFESSAIIKHPNIDYNNYYEVKGAFNLKD